MHLIFDFDGTLIDSFHCVMEKANLLADRFHFRKIEKDEIETLRDLSSLEFIKTLNVPFYKIPQLISALRKEMASEIPKLPPIAHIQEVLDQLRKADIPLGILTSNSVDNVTTWLEHQQLRQHFEFIHNESHYFSKNHLLKKTLKKYKIDKDQAFYIGDETRDIDAASENGVKSVAVTWGYHSEKILTQHSPSFLARKPEDLLKICSLTNLS